MAFSLVFLLVGFIFAVTIVLVFGGMLFHFFATGSLFWVVNQHLRRQLEQAGPKLCEFCGGNIPAGETNCPQCGGPRHPPDSTQ